MIRKKLALGPDFEGERRYFEKIVLPQKYSL
jgi:hypothetical protein